MNDFTLRDALLDDEQFFALALRHLDGIAGPEEEAALIELLRDNPDDRRRFVTLCRQIGMLHESCLSENGEEEWSGSDELGIMSDELFAPKSELDPSSFVLHPSESLPPIVVAPSRYAYNTAPLTSFGGIVLSYAVSAMLVGLALLGAWAYRTSPHYRSLAISPNGASVKDGTAPQQVYVGRVTGMKDCRWADPETIAYLGSAVPLGRKYALSAGLMEVTYDTGAKVILEGPCAYQVESRAGGYLGLGKLTARVGERGEGRGERAGSLAAAPTRREPSQAANPDPQARTPNPEPRQSPAPLSTLHSPLFSVRTPTATVSDLGTEFGVQVSANGDTTSFVFQGRVVVRIEDRGSEKRPAAAVAAEGGGRSIQLSAGESARVERGTQPRELRLIPGAKAGAAPKFVRRLYEPPKLIDLLDIVAGGDGTGHRRETRRNPANGEIAPTFVAGWRKTATRKYLPVPWSNMIDGVFIPDGSDEPVQLDSARHTFSMFPYNARKRLGNRLGSRAGGGTSARETANGITRSGSARWGRRRYMPERRGLLAMSPNVGLTFDLAGICKAHPEAIGPSRFRAVAGLAHPEGLADVWVFVDGNVRVERRGIREPDGPIRLDVPLAKDDRFLTLVTTDGGDTVRCDHVVFGDPVLWLDVKPAGQEQEGKR